MTTDELFNKFGNDYTLIDHLQTYPNDNDKANVVLTAMFRNGSNVKYASERLKDDKQFAIEAVKHHSHVLKYLSPRLQDDEDVVLAALKQYPMSPLEFASKRILNNKDFALVSISITACNIFYFNEALGNDIDILKTLRKSLNKNKEMKQEFLENYPKYYKERMDILKKYEESAKLKIILNSSTNHHQSSQDINLKLNKKTNKF
jgi:hypothetical protein